MVTSDMIILLVGGPASAWSGRSPYRRLAVKKYLLRLLELSSAQQKLFLHMTHIGKPAGPDRASEQAQKDVLLPFG
jgi:hypothetical protein